MKVSINWGRLSEGTVVSLWCVSNTSHNSLYVLAHSRPTALEIAHAAAHIYAVSTDYAWICRHIYEVKSPMLLDKSKLERLSGCIENASDQRIQGTVEFKEDHIVVGHEIFFETVSDIANEATARK